MSNHNFEYNGFPTEAPSYRPVPTQTFGAPGQMPGQAYAQMPGQAYAQTPGQAYAQPPSPGQAKRKNRWLTLPAVALLAALASSGLTAAAVSQNPPAVGAATTTRVVQGVSSNPDWTQTAAVASPSVVSIQVQGRSGGAEGSGVILDTAGNIVTNNHVVSAVSGAQLAVTLADRQQYAATVVGTDPSTDLAVIRLQNAPAGLQPIAWGDVSQLKVGQPVMAVGNPLGLSETVTTGIVSALDRPVVTQQTTSGTTRQSAVSQQAASNAIQTNAAINPGNSGGALVNAEGQLIGITSSIATLSDGSESGNIGIGFAIPADEVKNVTDQLLADGRASHAYLGVASADARATVGSSVRTGAGVTTVASGTPAAQAGLKVGDVIVGINGKPVVGSDALVASIREFMPGDRATLVVVRSGKEEQFAVTLADAPQ